MSLKHWVYWFASALLVRCPVRLILLWSRAKLTPYDPHKHGRKVLVLDSERFRDDLEGMGNYSNLELICMPLSMQDFISRIIYYKNIRKKKTTVGENDLTFLTKYLAVLKKREKYCAVMSAGFFYRRNEIWEISAGRASLPFVCLHRESAGEEPSTLERLTFPKELRKFHGKSIFVGTEGYRNALVNSGFQDGAKITATGLPRFDVTFHHQAPKKDAQERKSIVLFSFLPATLITEVLEEYGHHTEEGFRDLFYSVHSSIGILAAENSEVDFKIKPKWYKGQWKRYIDSALSDTAGLDQAKLANLSISDKWSAQDLIKNASLVVAFNSTTMIESLLLGKPVIAPWYAEAAEKYQGSVLYREYAEAFIVAKSEGDYRQLIQDHIDSRLEVDCDGGRLIADVVGVYDGQCAKRIEEEILTLGRTPGQ
jgi:hypothetical protein